MSMEELLSNNAEEFLAKEIKRFVVANEANRLAMIDNTPMFDEPLVGFINGDDPIFNDYKRIIGDFHWRPRDMMEQCAKDEGYQDDVKDVSVICWILPIVKKTIKSNAERDDFPSPRWAHTRDYGEKFNVLLRKHVVGLLRDEGLLAVAPMDSSYFQPIMDERVGFASTWSERHAMYAAGLGTFSLTDALITPRGIAHRCGSVIVNMKLKPTPRIYEDHYANCLFHNSGSCGTCIKRCPSGALSEEGHDKSKCGVYVYQCIEGLREEYGIDVTTGCGLCQAGVPCSTRIPKRPEKTEDG